MNRKSGPVHLYQGDETLISAKPLELPVKEHKSIHLYADTRRSLPVMRPKHNRQSNGHTEKANGGPEPGDAMMNDEDDLYASVDRSQVTGDNFAGQILADLDRVYCTHFVVSCTEKGELTIISLPDRKIVFTCPSIAYLPSSLSDSSDAPQEPLPPPEDYRVQDVQLVDIGQSRPTPHLCVSPSI